jgi:hypothetical protein
MMKVASNTTANLMLSKKNQQLRRHLFDWSPVSGRLVMISGDNQRRDDARQYCDEYQESPRRAQFRRTKKHPA